MRNLKKLTRDDLRNLRGGKACSVAIQGSDGSWTIRTGTCSIGSHIGMGYCETGLGNITIISNGGNSHCND